MIHFVVHEPGDGVGVVVVEGVKAGDDLIGWVMDGDLTLNMKSESDIPIGHKISLNEFKPGDTVMKYGVDIGKVVAPIKTIASLDVPRYQGTWYEIAKFPNWFQRKCIADTNASYKIKDDGNSRYSWDR